MDVALFYYACLLMASAAGLALLGMGITLLSFKECDFIPWDYVVKKWKLRKIRRSMQDVYYDIRNLFKSQKITFQFPQDLKISFDMVASNDYRTLRVFLAQLEPSEVVTLHRKRKLKASLTNLAARIGRTKCMDILLQYNSEYNTKDVHGSTALHLAARCGKMSIVKMLLDNKADTQSVTTSGWTALHLTALNGRVEVAKLLLAYKSDINYQSFDGRTALACACSNGHNSTVAMLLNEGANPKIKDVNGSDALHHAAQNGCVYQISRLIEAGLSPVERNNLGETSVQLAAFRGHCDFVLECLTLNEMALSSLADAAFDCYMIPENKREGDRFKNVCSVIKHVSLLPEYRLYLTAAFSGRVLHLGMERLKDPEPEPVEIETSNSSPSLTTSSKLETYSKGDSEPSPAAVSSAMPANGGQEAAGEPQSLSPLESAGNKDAKGDAQNNQLEQATKLLVLTMNLMEEASADGNMQIELQSTLEIINPLWISLDHAFSQFKKKNGKTVAEIFDFSRKTSAVLSAYHFCCQGAEKIGSTTCVAQLQKSFVEFMDKHSPLVRLMIETDPQLLTKDLDFILKNAWRQQWGLKDLVLSLAFDCRREWFYEKLKELQRSFAKETAELVVPREDLGNQSCRILTAAEGKDHFKGELMVKFSSEEGNGAGVRREWFRLICEEIFNEDNGLFKKNEKHEYQPTLLSSINEDHLTRYRFVGQIVALGIYNKELFSVSFTRAFYKHLLQIPLDVNDLQSFGNEYFKSIKWILENTIDEYGLELNFSVENDLFGVIHKTELKPGGKDIVVTDQNKHEYVELLIQSKLKNQIEPQIKAFCEGFYSIIPYCLVGIFSESEFENLLCGSSEQIDVNDWKDNTVLTHYNQEDQTIQSFWEVVTEFTPDQRIHLLEFCTGSGKIPLGGFAKIKDFTGATPFTIVKSDQATSRLPTVSTCFNLLKLPDYQSKSLLREKLLIAIEQGKNGFSFQ